MRIGGYLQRIDGHPKPYSVAWIGKIVFKQVETFANDETGGGKNTHRVIDIQANR